MLSIFHLPLSSCLSTIRFYSFYSSLSLMPSFHSFLFLPPLLSSLLSPWLCFGSLNSFSRFHDFWFLIASFPSSSTSPLSPFLQLFLRITLFLSFSRSSFFPLVHFFPHIFCLLSVCPSFSYLFSWFFIALFLQYIHFFQDCGEECWCKQCIVLR